jgi:RNA polymerase sigma-70 factor (ECF subfamily)
MRRFQALTEGFDPDPATYSVIVGNTHDIRRSCGLTTELVERAQGGDRDAFDLLASAAYHRLYAVARRVLRDTHSAEDAVQETLIHAWRDLRSLRDPERFDAWTYRLLVRSCADQARRRRRISVEVTDIAVEPQTSRDDYAAVLQRDEIERAFLKLSVEHRAVLVLTHYVGLPAAQVAQYMGTPVGTVYSRLHYATQTMREVMESPSSVDQLSHMPGQVL